MKQCPSKKRKFSRDKKRKVILKNLMENVLFVINMDIEPMIADPKDKLIRDNQTKVKFYFI